MAQIRLSVLLGDVSPERYPDIVERCRRTGFVVENELTAIGVIVGWIDEACVPALSQIEGVTAVEPQREHRSYPPR